MTHALLLDPENAKAYQTLCDNPRGSTRAWADKAGWTHSRMRTFLQHIEHFKLGHIEVLPRGSVFVPTVRQRATACDTVRRRADKAFDLDTEKKPKDESRSATSIADPDGARLIAAMNAGFACRPESNFSPIDLSNYGSLAAAAKILAKVPVDRAVPLLEEACRQFNPSHSGGEWPFSLGHPFFYRYVVKAYQLVERELEVGQKSFVFVESVPRYQEYSPPPTDRPIADPATVDSVSQDWRAIANSPNRPRRA